LPRFGNYDLVHRVDVGGMGEVYLAHQRSAFGRDVAIKIIRSDLVHDVTARARFLREAEVSAHLKHEHILPLFEFGEDQGRLFLVTPFIEGGTLARRLKNGPLTLEEVHALFVPLVQAVAYIHRRGVIHRDLKPTNVLLDEEDGQLYVRLIDFGIASVQGSSASPPLTTAGNEIGTLAYMAPERLSGVAAPSNDIFSLGVILYQMLTGSLPVGQQAPDLLQPLEYVVRRCIANRPEDRFATAEEVLQNFEHAYQSLMTSSQAQARVISTPLSAGQSPSRHLSNALRRPSNALIDENVEVVEHELVSLRQFGSIPVAIPSQSPGTFKREDYNAPTTWFDPAKQQGQQTIDERSKPAKTAPSGKRRSLLPLLSAITAILVLAVIGTGYYTYQVVTATSVNVNVSPQAHVINQVYTIKVDPTIQTANLDTQTIPARPLSSNEQSTMTGPTTGQVNCTFGYFGCQQGVSQSDVDSLVSQIRPQLEQEITQELENKTSSVSGKAVSPINFQMLSITSQPGVGETGNTVTVTVQEQGSIGYILPNDATNMAQQLVTRQAQHYGPNYLLLTSSITTGSPVIEEEDSGLIDIKIAAGCIVQYQFPQSELQAIPDGLKGRTLKDALNYLAHLQGVDPNTIIIHFTIGKSDILPGDSQRIKIISIYPISLPPVHLQSVPTPTFTPTIEQGNGTSPTPGDTTSPTVTPTNN
ncbi:MAG TPA: serine/threonine-protein kinase, partial [Ktedonobacteraceae bacterium]|nr:serine/threonine-protein kinase [Ktedonobacteraceae bacterium]